MTLSMNVDYILIRCSTSAGFRIPIIPYAVECGLPNKENFHLDEDSLVFIFEVRRIP